MVCPDADSKDTTTHRVAWRNWPKSLGGVRSVALRAANRGFFGPSAVRIPAKFTVEALLVPLFGQFQKVQSRKFTLTVLLRVIANTQRAV